MVSQEKGKVPRYGARWFRTATPWQHPGPVEQNTPSRAAAPAVAIRPAHAADAEALALVGAATFLETFAGILDGADIVAHCANQHASEVYRSLLARPRARAWLAEAEVGRAPVGYVLLDDSGLVVRDPSPGDMEIKRIYLLRRFQGTGVGRGMMDAAITDARAQGATRLLLGVYSRNTRAITFYEKAGFHLAGERRFKVGGNHYDDVILARDL
jgi:diamine N-acetyltransferase